jgi:hypothetical protein
MWQKGLRTKPPSWLVSQSFLHIPNAISRIGEQQPFMQLSSFQVRFETGNASSRERPDEIWRSTPATCGSDCSFEHYQDLVPAPFKGAGSFILLDWKSKGFRCTARSRAMNGAVVAVPEGLARRMRRRSYSTFRAVPSGQEFFIRCITGCLLAPT